MMNEWLWFVNGIRWGAGFIAICALIGVLIGLVISICSRTDNPPTRNQFKVGSSPLACSRLVQRVCLNCDSVLVDGVWFGGIVDARLLTIRGVRGHAGCPRCGKGEGIREKGKVVNGREASHEAPKAPGE